MRLGSTSWWHWRRPGAHHVAWLVLAVWAAGLAVATYRLEAWQTQLTQTLVQLKADAQFRAQWGRNREAVDPEWYRRKALALLSATERMQADARWTVFLPGSWWVFDPLEERVAERLRTEFDEIVVETLQGELLARARQLAGLPPLRARTAAQAAECLAPATQGRPAALSVAADDLPEFIAVRNYVDRVQELDRAVRAFVRVQRTGRAEPEELQALVRYALGAELSGPLARSVPLFHRREDASVRPAILLAGVQGATRCSLYKGMSALHARLLDSNELFALEQSIQEASAGLFDEHARAATFDRTVERYRTLAKLLQDQEALLAQGRNGWMRQGSLRLGPAYDELTGRIERTGLFGPDVVAALNRRSDAAFVQFRRRFDALFGQGEPGIRWVEAQERFTLSDDREALRAGLVAVLQEPFMSDEAWNGTAMISAAHPAALGDDEAGRWLETRERFMSEKLPLFPSHARRSVAQLVDMRLSELVYQRAFRALSAAGVPDAASPFDAWGYRQRGEQVRRVQAVLDRLGARPLGERLRATHAAELTQRLAVAADRAARWPVDRRRPPDFSWWNGEPAPLLQALGVTDAAAAQRALAEQMDRLDGLAREAAQLLGTAGPGMANDPQAQRWAKLAAENQRWRARRPDSSALAMERYLAWVGPDLRRENCVERLAFAPRIVHDDEIGLRLVHLHRALQARCAQLRSEAGPAASPAPALSVTPAPAARPASPLPEAVWAPFG